MGKRANDTELPNGNQLLVQSDEGQFTHVPVLLDECIAALNIKPNGIYLDGTAGGAGHALHIAAKLKTGMLIALDRDPEAVETATKRLDGLRAKVLRANFSDAAQVLGDLGISGLDGALLDLGVSSHQLDTAERGFSYNADAPLDMRMDKQGETAAQYIARATREELANTFRIYGEEQYAWNIAGRIVNARQQAPIETTLQLSEIVKSALPPQVRRKAKHPARKVFQALRIEINGEMDALKLGLYEIFSKLNSGGRLCVITFHSVEDRVVKHIFKEFCKSCICPPELPLCICGGVAKALEITKKPIVASEEELALNRRSRSAKLRVIERLEVTKT